MRKIGDRIKEMVCHLSECGFSSQSIARALEIKPASVIYIRNKCCHASEEKIADPSPAPCNKMSIKDIKKYLDAGASVKTVVYLSGRSAKWIVSHLAPLLDNGEK